MFAGPVSRLAAAGSGPSRIVAASGQSAVLAGGLASLEAFSDSGRGVRAGTSLELLGRLARGIDFTERISVWAGSDERPPTGFAPFHEGTEEGRHMYVDWGFLRARSSTLEAAFGRLPQRWGPGRFTSLLVSAEGPALDMLRLRWTPSRNLVFTGFTSLVESDSSIWLSAHRLDIRPWRWLRLGASEAILFRSSGADLAYMNPVIPWYPVQWNERLDDNAMLCFDATAVPLTGLSLWGELLVDDIQYQSDNDMPDKLAFTAGACAASAGCPVAAAAEYTRIDRYVYSQRQPWNYYVHDGAIIGSGLGPDADRATLSLSSAAAWPLTAEVRAQHSRHGEGTVSEGWPDSVQAGGAFPSGTVEHSTRLSLILGWFPERWLEAGAVLDHTWTRNAGNEQGVSEDGTTAALEAAVRW
jgi:hypothetical protein